jgi:catechol 1,2-dioxygenase
VPRTAETVATSRKGTSLVVTGVVYAEDCRTPLAGATVDAWQTTADGRYGPGGSSTTGTGCCYLQGEIRTDSLGRYAVDTVVPGRYAGSEPPPRHIHLAVSHPRARSLTTELTFAGDRDVSPDDPLAVTPTEQGTRLHIQFAIVLRAR